MFTFEQQWQLAFELCNVEIYQFMLASNKRDIGKQCRPRSEAAKRGAW